MNFLVYFAISIAITAVSMIIQKKSADKRAKRVEALNEERKRLQDKSIAIERVEKGRLINIQTRKRIAERRSTAVTQGQDVESFYTSSNLQDRAILSSREGAVSLLDKRTGSLLALNKSTYDLTKAQSATPGLGEMLLTGGLDTVSSMVGMAGGIEAEKYFNPAPVKPAG
jgi:hypothetical protein